MNTKRSFKKEISELWGAREARIATIAKKDLYEFYEININNEIDWMFFNDPLTADVIVDYLIKHPEE